MSRSTTRLATPTPVVVFPCGSMSTTSTRRPSNASDAPRFTAVVDLPTPPFWLTIAITRAVVCTASTADKTDLPRRGEMLVDVALGALREQARLVQRRVVGDLLEERLQHLADPGVAAESRCHDPFALEDRNHVVAAEGELAQAQRRLLREHRAHPGLEALVGPIALAQPRAVDVGAAQGEKPLEMLGADAAEARRPAGARD